MGCLFELLFNLILGPVFGWLGKILGELIGKAVDFFGSGIPVIKEWLGKLWDKISYRVERISKKLRKKPNPPAA